MTDADIETETEPRPPLPLPKEAQRMLRTLLETEGTGFIDESNGCIVAGTPSRPGQVVPATLEDWLALVAKALVAGERGLFILRQRGRELARHGRVSDGDSAVTDVDLAAWGRGEIDYLTGELMEAIDARFARVATTRREALDLLLQEGVITVAEARRDA